MASATDTTDASLPDAVREARARRGVSSEADRKTELICTADSVRGRLGRGVTTPSLASIAGKFAVHAASTSRSDAPLLLGHDGREVSRSLLPHVLRAVLGSGVDVIVCGRATRPGLRSAAALQSVCGALLVSTAGVPVGWAGLDVIGPAGCYADDPEFGLRFQAVCKDSALSESTSAPPRLRRQAGRLLATVAALPTSDTSLFRPDKADQRRHARAVSVLVGAASEAILHGAAEVLSSTSCRTELVSLPHRVRDLDDAADTDLSQLREHARETGADLACLIDDDAERCVIFDEVGRVVPTILVANTLRQWLAPTTPMSLQHGARVDFRDGIGLPVDSLPESVGGESDFRGHLARRGPFAVGIDHRNRIWMSDANRVTNCAAVDVLAGLCRAVSDAHHPASRTLREPMGLGSL